MFQQLLSTQTFQDHAGESSFGRKACFWILLAMGILALFGLLLIAFKADPKVAKELAVFTLGVIGYGVGLVSVLYGSAQISKASSHIGDGLAGRASVTTTTATTPPTPATIAAAGATPNSNAPPTAATTPTTTIPGAAA